jgi:hypothetical protein
MTPKRANRRHESNAILNQMRRSTFDFVLYFQGSMSRPGNSPLTAVNDFLATEAGAEFHKERSIEKRHL